MIALGEECDDQNSNTNDGCSYPGCTVNHGYSCSSEPSSCSAVCGDGLKANNETCDDGNTSDNDGCHGNCLSIESNGHCDFNFEPNKCAICGQGF